MWYRKLGHTETPKQACTHTKTPTPRYSAKHVKSSFPVMITFRTAPNLSNQIPISQQHAQLQDLGQLFTNLCEWDKLSNRLSKLANGIVGQHCIHPNPFQYSTLLILIDKGWRNCRISHLFIRPNKGRKFSGPQAMLTSQILEMGSKEWWPRLGNNKRVLKSTFNFAALKRGNSTKGQDSKLEL
jgi:hypothetical protein